MAEQPTLSIELGDVATYHCPCCDGHSETVHGFLYDDTGATAVYFIGYTLEHSVRRANVLVSIGGWGEGTTASDRHAIAMQVGLAEDELAFEFVPPETSPWYREEFLGRMVTLTELSPPEGQEAQRLARFAVENDPRVADYFQSRTK